MDNQVTTAKSETLTREQRLEAALRHARAIVAADREDLRARANHGLMRQHSSIGQARKLWAQIDERDKWLAYWDAALAPDAAPEQVAPGTPDPRD